MPSRRISPASSLNDQGFRVQGLGPGLGVQGLGPELSVQGLDLTCFISQGSISEVQSGLYREKALTHHSRVGSGTLNTLNLSWSDWLPRRRRDWEKEGAA